MKNMYLTTPFSFKLTALDDARLKEASKVETTEERQHVSPSVIARKALREYLDRRRIEADVAETTNLK